MNVNSTHFEYEASLGGWSRARALIASEDAVKGTGDNYPPRLDVPISEDGAAYGSPATRVVQRTFRCVLGCALLLRGKVARQETCQILFGLCFVAGCRKTVPWRRKMQHPASGDQGARKSHANFAA